MLYFQQGDVVMIPVALLPAEAVDLNTNVLQEGEHTGHAHRLQIDESLDVLDRPKVFQMPSSLQKYFEVKAPTNLNHEEHHTINLPPGIYEVRIVREYDHFKEEARQVVD